MGTLETEINGSIQRRHQPRFNLTNPNVVSVQLGKRTLVPKWINDLSSTGFQFRMSHFRAHRIGDPVNVKIRINGSMVVNAHGSVVWKRPSTEAINMFDYGVRFEAINKIENLTHWEKNGFACKAKRRQGLEAIKHIQKESQKRINRKKIMTFAVVLTFSFALGFAQAIAATM